MIESQAFELLLAVGCTLCTGPDVDDAGQRIGRSSVVLRGRAKVALRKRNLHFPDATIDAVVASLARPPHPTLIENNRWFHGLLTDGVPVEYQDGKTGEMRGGQVRVIDFDNPAKNDFLVVRQLTVQGPSGKTIRPDWILYVNGLPLVIIEIQDPTDASADLDLAIDQLGRDKETAPDLFVPNMLLVVSDGLLTRVGSITSGGQRFTPWRSAESTRKDRCEPTLEALIRELLAPKTLLDYLQSWVTFEEDERGNLVKQVAGDHQFRAVRKTRAIVIAEVKRGTGFQPVNLQPVSVPSISLPPVTNEAQRQDAAATEAQRQDAAATEAQRQDAAATGIHIRYGANLPHWTREGGIYSVTFRLVDSLPQAVQLMWKKERQEIINRARQNKRPLSPAEHRQLQHLFSEKVEKFLDAGIGQCWMRRPEIADIVADALSHFDGERYRLLSWCVMPNHVHVVVKPLPGHKLSNITHSWKSFTSNKANRLLERTGTFWQTESYDHLIRDDEDLEHAVTYVLNNPRAAGLDPWKWVGSAADIGEIVEDRDTGF
jgi:REP element-mobilizing transposase RayT